MAAMEPADLRTLLDAVASGAVAPDEAATRLAALPFADLGFARVDHHRALRQGMAEAVYAPGKTPGQCAAIVGELLGGGTGPVLLTRADAERADAARAANPGATSHPGPLHAGVATETLVWRPAPSRPGDVVLACAGTSDLAVAGEAAAVLEAHGVAPVRLTDVGVAGLHRLLAEVEVLQAADAVVVVAGMEGALASVVGGLTSAPVVAVPVATGYGAAFEGVTALLAMLSSCAAGVSVVGIDNGYGAACAVLRHLRPA
jgi:NCAIR mutase (PurE)-related protein